jgi:low affinity Fe/Cu permease
MQLSRSWFDRLATWAAHISGRSITFVLAVGVVLVWLVTGPFFHFSDTWQLVINTGTTIVTFLMVFLIQSSQNRDTAAIQLKLDELIRALKGAHNNLLDLEDLSEDELLRIRSTYRRLAQFARESGRGCEPAVGCPEVEQERSSEAIQEPRAAG